MRSQVMNSAAALVVALAASPALAMGRCLDCGRPAPARSRARVLAFSCLPADITWFAVGTSETLKNSLVNFGNYFMRDPTSRAAFRMSNR